MKQFAQSCCFCWY